MHDRSSRQPQLIFVVRLLSGKPGPYGPLHPTTENQQSAISNQQSAISNQRQGRHFPKIS
jgi:hypothetical protein